MAQTTIRPSIFCRSGTAPRARSTHTYSKSLLKYVFFPSQLIVALSFCTSPKTREEEEVKEGGRENNKARRCKSNPEGMRGGHCSTSQYKGRGERSRGLGTTPRGRGWRGGGTLGNKVQVTSKCQCRPFKGQRSRISDRKGCGL